MLSFDEPGRLLAALGERNKAMMLRQHGTPALGTSVRDALEMLYCMQRACEIQIDALSAGAEGVPLAPPASAEHAYAQFTRPGREANTKDWPARLRCLDRRGNDYRS